MVSYAPLTLCSPNGQSRLLKANSTNTPHLGLDDPALEIMTDFCRTPAISVPTNTLIDTALHHMIYSGVRLLFVVNPIFGLLGSITSYDIESEKPMRYMQSKDCRIATCSRKDLTVEDIMTPVQKWQALNYKDVANATLGNIVQSFRNLGQRHVFVIETTPDRGTSTVRGLFSVSSLERALRTTIEIVDIATNFAEIERALA